MFIFNNRANIYFFNTKDLYTKLQLADAATFLTSTFILRILFNISISKVS